MRKEEWKGVASSGWEQWLLLRASNVVGRVELFGQAL